MPIFISFRFVPPLLATIFAALGGCDVSSTSTNAVQSAAAVLAISGTPAKTAVVGAGYSFHPKVAAANGATLSFAVSNAPAWARFDTLAGTLSGTPTVNDVGSYKQILITVSDSTGTVALAPFTIDVMSGSSAVASITWTTPVMQGATQNLLGYKVYYGITVKGMTHVVDIADPTATNYVIDNLSTGTWYFAIASYDSNKIQSELSPTLAVNL